MYARTRTARMYFLLRGFPTWVTQVEAGEILRLLRTLNAVAAAQRFVGPCNCVIAQ